MKFFIGKTYKGIYSDKIITCEWIGENGKCFEAISPSFYFYHSHRNLENGYVIPYIKPGDFIRKENIKSEHQLNQIRELVKKMGHEISPVFGSWKEKDSHPAHKCLILGVRTHNLIWGEYPVGKEWTPEELLGESEMNSVEDRIEKLEKELAELKGQKGIDIEVGKNLCLEISSGLEDVFIWDYMEEIGVKPNNFMSWGDLSDFFYQLGKTDDPEEVLKDFL